MDYFSFYPFNKGYEGYYYKKGIEPYVSGALINGTVNINDYAMFYAKRIQMNGWKVPDELRSKF